MNLKTNSILVDSLNMTLIIREDEELPVNIFTHLNIYVLTHTGKSSLFENKVF